MSDPAWWKGSALYQIYPRSFYDSNSDGIGDLPGITEKLPYVADLGVKGVWISPFFPSPMKDFGYDVSDYRDVDPIFGTLNDFDTLLKRAHDLGLKIIIDLVLSHTSDQHPWFHDPAKKDWYVWADGKENGPPNNWVSVFGGPAWTRDERYNQYYLHNFLKEQPDLNFHNPEVQDEALDIARFWLERGVDGFRLDVVNFYFHDPELRDNPPRDSELGSATQFEGDDPYSQQQHIYDKSRPENLAFLKRFRALMNAYPDTFTIGEIGDDHPYERAAEYTAGDDYLHTCYNTHLMSGVKKSLTSNLIREPFERFAEHGAHSWPSWAFSNHDVVRVASRWHDGGDGFSHDQDLSKMLIALLLCLRGTVFLYQGEELGLPEARLDFEDLQDPWGKHLWPEWQGRDGCRTPIIWDQDMTASNSWLPFSDSHMALSIALQNEHDDSCLNFARDLLRFKDAKMTLKCGKIAFSDTKNKTILHFERVDNTENLQCFYNLSCDAHILEIRDDLKPLKYRNMEIKDGSIYFEKYGFLIAEKLT